MSGNRGNYAKRAGGLRGLAGPEVQDLRRKLFGRRYSLKSGVDR